MDPVRRSRNQRIIERCAQWGKEHGLVRSWEKGRMQQDQRHVKYTLVIAPQRYGAQRPEEASEQERLTLVERFYAQLGTKAAESKLRRDAAIVAQLLADGFGVEDITFAGEWAVQHIPGVTSFGLLPYIMHHALKAKHEARQTEAAKHEAAARLQAHLQQQQAEAARTQRLEAFRATLAEEALEALQSQAEAALAAADVGPGHVAYSLMLKLRLNDLIEEAFRRAEAQG